MKYQAQYENQNWIPSGIEAASPLEAAQLYLAQDFDRRYEDYDRVVVFWGRFGKQTESFLIHNLLASKNEGDGTRPLQLPGAISPGEHAMKTCVYCGHSNEDTALTCSGCGTSEFKRPTDERSAVEDALSRTEPAPPRSAEKLFASTWLIVALGFAITVVVLGFMASRPEVENGFQVTFAASGSEARRWAEEAKINSRVEILASPFGDPLPKHMIDALIAANKSVFVRRHMPNRLGEVFFPGTDSHKARMEHRKGSWFLSVAAALLALSAGVVAAVRGTMWAKLRKRCLRVLQGR